MPSPPKQVVVSNRDIGLRVRLLRQEQGLSQVELARRLGLTQPNLSAIECGRRGVTVHQVVKIARALRVPTDQILLDEKAPATGRRPRKRLMRRLLRIEELPYRDQRVLVQIVDGFLRHHEDRQRRTQARSKKVKIPA